MAPSPQTGSEPVWASAFPRQSLRQRVRESDLKTASHAQRNHPTHEAVKILWAWICGQVTQLESSPDKKEKCVSVSRCLDADELGDSTAEY